MEDYQKVKINTLLRTLVEGERKCNERMKELPGSMSLMKRAAEKHGYANGVREACEILGYSIRYEDGIPQVV